jgi:hypothetical protein
MTWTLLSLACDSLTVVQPARLVSVPVQEASDTTTAVSSSTLGRIIGEVCQGIVLSGRCPSTGAPLNPHGFLDCYFVFGSSVEKKLKQNSAALKKLREQLTVINEEYAHFLTDTDSRHLETIENRRVRLLAEIARRDSLQDELLDQM